MKNALDAMISNQDELAQLRRKVIGKIETQPSWDDQIRKMREFLTP